MRRSTIVAVAIKAGEQDRSAHERADDAKPSPRPGDSRPADRAAASNAISHLDISPAPCAQLAARKCADFLSNAVAFNAALQKHAAGASGAEATGRTHTRGSVIQFKGRAP